MKKVPIMRIARATHNIEQIVKMYTSGLGLNVIDSFQDHEGFDGVILGNTKWPYHLEFTKHHSTIKEEIPKSHPEDALVFYYGDEKLWLNACKKMLTSGFKASKSINPYWNKCGAVFLDCEDRRIILVKNGWNI